MNTSILGQLIYTDRTSWDEVFRVWKLAEGSDPEWQRFAREEKGYESWDAWRGEQAAAIHAERREWVLYDIPKPNTTIPHFLMGPFQGWQKHYPREEAHTHSFADLVVDHTDWVRSHDGIQARASHFPEQTQFIGIYAVEEDRIILFEGHHRAAAIALRVYEGNPISFSSPPTIALTTMNAADVALVRSLLPGVAKGEV
ncbi:MAG: hypothetical protein UV82_C0005G0025 [Candidatus Magasanikbacteria bacterium GW2011_GWD2_43_18]|uniref:Uncharacterized protein n=1 Tax=Candidatus Magasanikbacteria bacterium GW2011_GWE2_42_7 TaxID=1619052 RepID=A0A0G1BDU6_9BACT|nr:MAG: hypothetical protein UV18_C0005G0209 [Candidatus Magasanikbacteria bacterium GW2011_GWC2_42_27]KKS71359.1 MAG: hypothetical protein UV42_C0031G0008 [Candidatus Magasanikbacteria bacterium GW2011_GWE2_42_7]KKT04787.1 MAG: hypothetical protein UV82_C0005G0025 [Candidatus Magasanikbacteria bacterium GW2011_GWD2_43_18]KKT25854.1 MAG: hypothetical protein UW10_C0003G0015 [Candidatus Magasanikbacteria bacterium GW2011_GWA2_43_9]HBB37836.1 hypothetical protein [Candidatus Magasanikbacteria bac